jgi:hypothetical protein
VAKRPELTEAEHEERVVRASLAALRAYRDYLRAARHAIKLAALAEAAGVTGASRLLHPAARPQAHEGGIKIGAPRRGRDIQYRG